MNFPSAVAPRLFQGPDVNRGKHVKTTCKLAKSKSHPYASSCKFYFLLCFVCVAHDRWINFIQALTGSGSLHPSPGNNFSAVLFLQLSTLPTNQLTVLGCCILSPSVEIASSASRTRPIAPIKLVKASHFFSASLFSPVFFWRLYFLFFRH